MYCNLSLSCYSFVDFSRLQCSPWKVNGQVRVTLSVSTLWAGDVGGGGEEEKDVQIYHWVMHVLIKPETRDEERIMSALKLLFLDDRHPLFIRWTSRGTIS
jgi:hypothetical protein